MPDLDTTMGGSRDSFPETVWSSVLREPDPASPERRRRLNELCSRYWRPAYKFIRTSWGNSPDDAKDLTQAFFCHLLEGEVIAKYQPEKGRFRHFLKGALKLFLSEAHRDSRRLKRGGEATTLSLDVGEVETSQFAADRKQYSPEEIFDRQWAREVVAQSVEKLRRKLKEEGKEVYFKVYEAYEIRPGSEDSSYETVARAFGIAAHDVQNYLGVARDRLQKLILETVTDYVTTGDELAGEIDDLFAG